MKKINIISIFLLTLSCTTYSAFELKKNNNYPNGFPAKLKEWPHERPEGVTTDPLEKQDIINKTIKYLEENNLSFWGKVNKKNIQEYIKLLNSFSETLGTESISLDEIDIDWELEKDLCIKKIKSSKGHGEAIGALSRLFYKLNDAHILFFTNLMSNSVGWPYAIKSIPQITLGSYGASQAGAGFIICENDRVLVSSVVRGNDYNWKIGDEIIALNSVPWKDWINNLQSSNLPIIGRSAANDNAIHLNWLKSINFNIGLFQTITIKRINGFIETMDISDKFNRHNIKEMPFEVQLDKSKLLSKENQFVDGGYIKNTNIAYIQFSAFNYNKGLYGVNTNVDNFYKEFKDSIKDNLDSDGLIIDMRGNSGGIPHLAFGGLSYLIDDKVRPNFMSIVYVNEYGRFEVDDTSNSFLLGNDISYEKPIMILVDSSSVSAADALIYICSLYPQFTIIGQAHSGSYSGGTKQKIEQYSNEGTSAMIRYPSKVLYPYNNFDSSLMSRNFIDEVVSYKADDIKKHEDTLLKRALEKIKDKI